MDKINITCDDIHSNVQISISEKIIPENCITADDIYETILDKILIEIYNKKNKSLYRIIGKAEKLEMIHEE